MEINLTSQNPEDKVGFKDFINSLPQIDAVQPLVNKPPEIPSPEDDYELEAQNLALHYKVDCTPEDIKMLADLLRAVETIKTYQIQPGLYRLIIMLVWDFYAKCGNIMMALKMAFIYGMALYHSSDWEDIEEE